jgi:antitoxin component of RelBE/YafQ-DinJ toxin-antitoxin module
MKIENEAFLTNHYKSNTFVYMSRIIVQVPVSKELQASARRAAAKQGFSSLQDAIRLFLRQLALGQVAVRLEATNEERLSPAAERRYARIIRDIKSGKAKTVGFTDVKEMMNYLNS